MVAANTPTIADIKNNVSLNDARALLSIAICEVCNFFNIGKNMNDSQIAVTVDLILEYFWYFRLEEIKYCFRRAMMREKLYDRLDGNIILGWLKEYDSERTEEAIRISENEESSAANATTTSADAVDFETYLAELEVRAKTDDAAARLLEQIKNSSSQQTTHMSNEERAKKDHDFKMWKQFDYLLKKK